MRVKSRLQEERGATAVMMVLALVATTALLALVIDGGLLLTKYRQVRRANDAAALAAAIECVKHPAPDGSTDAAEAMASDYAEANGAERTPWTPNGKNVYLNNTCLRSGGEVTVYYGAWQAMSMFAPAIGLAANNCELGKCHVTATATVTWGAAGAAGPVIPLMLSSERLSSPGCDIPLGAQPGTKCYFWWDNGNGNNTSVLTNAEWGLMDLTSWGVSPTGSCPGNVSQSDFTKWVVNGFPGVLSLDAKPTYVCRGSGFQGNALNNDVETRLGQVVVFPVNDPNQQVQSNGELCRPDGIDGNCTVQKYAIVGFGVMEISGIYTGQLAQDKCGQTSGNNGSLRCLEATWRDYQTIGLKVDPNAEDFGLVTVALTR